MKSFVFQSLLRLVELKEAPPLTNPTHHLVHSMVAWRRLLPRCRPCYPSVEVCLLLLPCLVDVGFDLESKDLYVMHLRLRLRRRRLIVDRRALSTASLMPLLPASDLSGYSGLL